jgi:hypothetical protein
MEIIVTFANGKLRAVPDPVTVTVGTPVTWLLRGPQLATALARWTVYFNHGSPLHLRDGVSSSPLMRMRVTTRNTRLGTITHRAPQILNLLGNAGVDTADVVDHSGVVGPVFADQEGDYKYGVRLTSIEGEKEQLLDDDDPRLIVQRRSYSHR